MISLFTLILAFSALSFPTFMLCLCYPFSRRAAVFWSDFITNRTSRIFFAILKMYRKFSFIGGPKDNLPGHFVVISNHQSLLDIVVFLKYFYPERIVRFVAKDALGKVPMVGKMLRSQGHCMIPRKGGAGIAMRSIEDFGKRMLVRKQNPIIFPEGTRSRDGSLGQFYSAGFRRLEETVRLPVVVCALDGGWKLSRIDDIFKNLHRGAYRVKILKIYDAPSSKDEEKKILEEAPVLIQAQLDKWRGMAEDSAEL
ncbi:lysophospholipid acyltransferase family protein [Treponema sp.]|uniref:lysophospholipid acyltransferase family protein n=1 Tax=Treponema sp. TaxID=166 RepID=UPI00257A1285|nr:lysophospholipid acyltransferase family protein [Treponema sp.]MBE6354471.1 1-acyl-sn-glycerol-3-phosphate acyltransferase [Treponema sp.]